MRVAEWRNPQFTFVAPADTIGGKGATRRLYKILGHDGNEYGPVSESELRGWFADRRADGTTKVQRIGETGWQPLSTLPEFSDLFPPPMPRAAPEPPPPPHPDPKGYAASVLNRDFQITPMDCISRGWELYKSDFWMIFGATFLIMLAASVPGYIPYIGIFISLAAHGILYGGLYFYFLKRIRGEKTQIEDAFCGFKRYPVQLILGGVVISFSSLFIFLASCIPLILTLIPIITSLQSDPHPDPKVLLTGLTLVGGLCLAVGVAVVFVLYLLWAFTFPLIIDKGLPFWDAMELSRKVVTRIFGSMFGLVFLSALIAMLGIFACIIGVYFTMPIPFLSMAHAYEDIFGTPKNPA